MRILEWTNCRQVVSEDLPALKANRVHTISSVLVGAMPVVDLGKNFKRQNVIGVRGLHVTVATTCYG